jgi:hypothetical protein
MNKNPETDFEIPGPGLCVDARVSESYVEKTPENHQ